MRTALAIIALLALNSCTVLGFSNRRVLREDASGPTPQVVLAAAKSAQNATRALGNALDAGETTTLSQLLGAKSNTIYSQRGVYDYIIEAVQLVDEVGYTPGAAVTSELAGAALETAAAGLLTVTSTFSTNEEADRAQAKRLYFDARSRLANLTYDDLVANSTQAEAASQDLLARTMLYEGQHLWWPATGGFNEGYRNATILLTAAYILAGAPEQPGTAAGTVALNLAQGGGNTALALAQMQGAAHQAASLCIMYRANSSADFNAIKANQVAGGQAIVKALSIFEDDVQSDVSEADLAGFAHDTDAVLERLRDAAAALQARTQQGSILLRIEQDATALYGRLADAYAAVPVAS
ncbi:hypothetical protein WJX73_007039 [Symbiochloris irregularis]|uniref:Lipoprotein n=1 Tax=Symbiochloris irregularis TaxID=706552 RepID=A0AAW1P5A6_9CHLO